MEPTDDQLMVAYLALVRGSLPVLLASAGFFIAREVLRLCGFSGSEKVQL